MMEVRETMKPIIITDRRGKTFTINPGDCFFAKDAHGNEYRYQYLGLMPDDCGYDHYLRNETKQTFANVELEWFAQRRITPIE